MALGIVVAVRNDMLQAIADAINAGTAGKLRIYSGTRPATGGAATTLLAELALSDPAQSGIASGVLTFDTIASDTSADASGTATWWRLLTSADAIVLDGSIAETSGGDINFDETAFVAGGTVAISSLTITAGNA